MAARRLRSSGRIARQRLGRRRQRRLGGPRSGRRHRRQRRRRRPGRARPPWRRRQRRRRQRGRRTRLGGGRHCAARPGAMTPSAGEPWAVRSSSAAGRGSAPRHTRHPHDRFSTELPGGILRATMEACFSGAGHFACFLRDVFRHRHDSLSGNSPPFRHSDLFPCPLPTRDLALRAPLSGRRRNRWHRRRLVDDVLDLVLCTLNWLALGRPRRRPSAEAFAGAPSAAQVAMVGHIRSMVWDMSRLAASPVSGGLSCIAQALDSLNLDLYTNSFDSTLGPLTITPERRAAGGRRSCGFGREGSPGLRGRTA